MNSIRLILENEGTSINYLNEDIFDIIPKMNKIFTGDTNDKVIELLLDKELNLLSNISCRNDFIYISKRLSNLIYNKNKIFDIINNLKKSRDIDSFIKDMNNLPKYDKKIIFKNNIKFHLSYDNIDNLNLFNINLYSREIKRIIFKIRLCCKLRNIGIESSNILLEYQVLLQSIDLKFYKIILNNSVTKDNIYSINKLINELINLTIE